MKRTDGARVVAVTGANEGIGHGIAAALLADGDRVAVLDVNGDGVDALAATHGDAVRYHECDVTDDDSVTTAVGAVRDEWGHIDVLVNNAAVFTAGAFLDRDPTDLRREFDVNYFGTVRTMRAVLPEMLKRDAGTVHTVSSGAGIVGHPLLSGYASTKGALEALVRSVRSELRHANVAVTLMHPPLTNTRSAARIGYPESLLADPDEVGRKLARKVDRTDAVIYADWRTRLGIALSRRFPALVDRGTARFVEEGE
ncbi:SDR family NAD(P)-dependent oxidoreductase [Halobaculum magnesiiphilum]|uniref:SDR family NAD(P)-dependent oxidoreductase n=1 Tax=Halobaculum magnesiiphilum TaxID=1017351 RepID=A0A8T8WJ65_9EURY|nr:SDR family NAD(P)-dependent oxidoreductase [Halobaculum magnesiiphilum]QZP39743.1 SDR family NAD(P)-dependent oxidoreductase [Halobaculum magnesiiphilum]